MPRMTIAQQLESIRLLLTTIQQHPDIKTRLADIGYNDALLAQGQQLYQQAIESRWQAHNAHGTQLGATEDSRMLRQQLQTRYRAVAKLVRTLYAGNPAVLEAMGLRLGQRATPEAEQTSTEQPTPAPRTYSRSMAAFLDRARLLFTGIQNTPDAPSLLATVGYSPTQFAADMALLANLEQRETMQEAAKSTARTSTATQQQTLADLQAWVARLRSIAGVMFANEPALLRQLGIK